MPVNANAKQDDRNQEPDPALIAAWRRLIDYDTKSTHEKKSYQQYRQWVIILSFSTTAIAVFSTFIEIEWIRTVLRYILVLLPIASVAIMNYAAEYATNVDWIEYRVNSEKLRSQITLYRLGMGEYLDKTPYERRELLLEKVREADAYIAEKGISSPYLQTTDDHILEKINAATRTGDDGLRPLNIDQYLKHRVHNQLTWYINKISADFASARKSNAIIITVSAIGALLAALGSGLEILVALTAALAFALSRMAEIRLYGATYAIYHSAAARLQVELGRWMILPQEERQKKEKQSEFVMRVENIFTDEMKQWREQAIRQLEANEQSILQNLQQARESLKDLDERKLLTLHEQEAGSEVVASSEG